MRTPKMTALPPTAKATSVVMPGLIPHAAMPGLTVDNLKPRPVDHGQAGTPNQRIRDDLHDEVKFTAVAANGLYPGVWQERGVFLTDEYMVDVFANRSTASVATNGVYPEPAP